MTDKPNTLFPTSLLEEADGPPRNASANPTMGEIISARFSRRGFLRGSLAVSAITATVSPLALLAADEAKAATGSRFSFTEVEAGVDDKHHLAEGYDGDILLRWGDPWAPGLSATADVWHLYINDTITPIFTQSVLNLCGADQTYYCQFVHRVASGPNQGQLASNFVDPIVNLGNTAAGGVDFSANYKLPQFDRIGQFTVGVNATYLKYYNVNTAPGTPANTTYYDAGHFMPNGSAQAAACPSGPSGTGPTTGAGSCLFPRWRGQGFLNWQSGNWDASWRMRYIGRFQMGSLDPTQDVHPAGPGLNGVVLKYGATVYNDISLGYNIEPLHTRVDFGVNNLFGKQPPFLFANNTLDSNTDPLDFDVVGRYFWGRVTVKF